MKESGKKEEKKRSLARRILKATAIVISIPIILFWLLIILLYVPPVQRLAVNEVCDIVKEESGFNLKIGSFHLAFPLKLKISDFELSQNDTIYATGNRLDVNVSLLPLMKGEVEVNYVMLEGVEVDTRELLPTLQIDGRIGFFRTVARNIDLSGEIANIRQLHLHSTDLNILLKDTVIEEEEEEAGDINWIVNLSKANIESCSFSVTIPGDTLSAAADIGKIKTNGIHADLGKGIYHLDRFSLKNSDISYDQGTESPENAPLSHLRLNEINIGISNVGYTPFGAKGTIDGISFIQPDGIRVTDASAKFLCSVSGIEIEELTLKSKNGSYISCIADIPLDAIKSSREGTMDIVLSMALNKKDLNRLLTAEELAQLAIFSEDMVSAKMNARGNCNRLELGNIRIDVPGIAQLNGNGYATEILDIDKVGGALNFIGETGNIRPLLGYSPEGKGNGRFDITGNVSYITGEADASFLIKGAGGDIIGEARYDLNKESYNADIEISGLDITEVMPDIPLHYLTMSLKGNGEGLDIFDSTTSYNAAIEIDTVHYDTYRLADITIDARQKNGLSDISVSSDYPDLQLTLDASTGFSPEGIKNNTVIDIKDIDFRQLGITDVQLGTGMRIAFDAATDLAESHSLTFSGEGIRIVTKERTYTPKDIALNFYTSPDTSFIDASNGDLAIHGTMTGGYNKLLKSLDKIASMYSKARYSDRMEYYLHDYERELPPLSFNFECGQKNMLSKFLAMTGTQAESINLSLKMDSISGLRMRSGIYGFRTGELNLDTIRAFTIQEGEKIRYLAGVRSTAINPNNEKETFNATLYGNIYLDSLTTNFVFRDSREKVGVRIGATTLLMPEGLNIRFSPDATLLGNSFYFDEENYINIGKEMSVEADITLNDSNGSGIHIYTNPDPDARYNANLELFNINLKNATSIVPFAPDIAGEMNLDLHYRQNDEGMLVSCDIIADSVAYEGTYIGNEILEVVYFPKNDDSHYLDVIVRHQEEEIAHLDGNYINDATDPGLRGKISLTRFPLSLSKAFLKDSGMEIDGYINSELTANGRLSRLKTDGFMQFDSVTVELPSLGTTLYLADELVNIEDNSLVFKDFEIYDKTNNPFKVNGTVSLADITNPAINLRMNATNYELVNSPRRKGAMLYGKMFIDFRSMIRGTLNNLNVSGNVSLLNKSNFTYVMLDSPIDSDKELDGLVEFVNFKDTAQIMEKQEALDLGNTKINLLLDIKEGARINADFDANRSSYIMLQGGGQLNLTYSNDAGLNLMGKYTMSDGQLKYTLPVIPLKTFNIVDGSYVNWNGDIFDPEIEITALESVTSSVTFDDNSMQPVAFDVGVKLSNTLSNMGLSFTMSAPENAVVQEQLNMLDAETMNKYAVTMLITGAYMGGSNKMSVSNALSSFLDAKINDLAGDAMKSVSVNVGINDAQNAETGGTYKNYSFSFSKRFWNDRLTIVIGGEVNSGDHPSGSDSFINNVSLEWKIDPNSNRYLRLFYDKNFKSILEGEITETGVGYVYKRKLNSLNELFIFKRKSKENDTERFSLSPQGLRSRERAAANGREETNKENGTTGAATIEDREKTAEE